MYVHARVDAADKLNDQLDSYLLTALVNPVHSLEVAESYLWLHLLLFPKHTLQ